MTKREQLYPEIKRLRDEEGLVWREIGERLGIAQSTVCDYYRDPDGSKSRARKSVYAFPCVDCGKIVNRNGTCRGDGRCAKCQAAWTRAASRRWILESMHEWAEMFGAPPAAADWSPAFCRGRGGSFLRRVERYEATGRPWPSVTLVQVHFGSWTAGLRAAGFEPLKPNEYAVGYRGMALKRADETA